MTVGAILNTKPGQSGQAGLSGHSSRDGFDGRVRMTGLEILDGAIAAAGNFEESLKSQLDALSTSDTTADSGQHEPGEMPAGQLLPQPDSAEAETRRWTESSASASQNAAPARLQSAVPDTKAALHAFSSTSTDAPTDTSADGLMNDRTPNSLRFGTGPVVIPQTGTGKATSRHHSASSVMEDKNKTSRLVSAGGASTLQFPQAADACVGPVNFHSAGGGCDDFSAAGSKAMEVGSLVQEPASAVHELHAGETPSSISRAAAKGQSQIVASNNTSGTRLIDHSQDEIERGGLRDEPLKTVSAISKISTDSVESGGEQARLSSANKLPENSAGPQTTHKAGQSVPVVAQVNSKGMGSLPGSRELSAASDGVPSAGTDANEPKSHESDAMQRQAGAKEAAAPIRLVRNGEIQSTRNPAATEMHKPLERGTTESGAVSVTGTSHVTEIPGAGSAHVKTDSTHPVGNATETFAALDAGSSAEPNGPGWTRRGHFHAEAGYRDPELGWVGVRAESVGGAVHATLIPPSLEAARTLGGHLGELHTFLANNHTPVQTLTMAASGGSDGQSGGQGSGHPMHQNSGEHAGNGNGTEQAAMGQARMNSVAGPGNPAASAASELLARNISAAGFTSTGFTGGHVSVRV